MDNNETKNKASLWMTILILLTLLLGAIYLYDRLSGTIESQQIASEQQKKEENVPQYQQAPDFTIYDLNGNEVHLSDFFGKPVIIYFWASWCDQCKRVMGDFEKAYEIYGEDVQFLIVNMTDGSRETVQTASEYVAKQGYTFPVYYDVNYSAADAYNVYALPTTYFVDGEGYAIAYAQSAIFLTTIEKGIGMITSE